MWGGVNRRRIVFHDLTFVRHFPALHFCPSNSSPAFSTPCNVLVRHFPVLHFQRPPSPPYRRIVCGGSINVSAVHTVVQHCHCSGLSDRKFPSPPERQAKASIQEQIWGDPSPPFPLPPFSSPSLHLLFPSPPLSFPSPSLPFLPLSIFRFSSLPFSSLPPLRSSPLKSSLGVWGAL